MHFVCTILTSYHKRHLIATNRTKMPLNGFLGIIIPTRKQKVLNQIFFFQLSTIQKKITRFPFLWLVSHYSESHTSIIILMLLPHNKRGMAVSNKHSLHAHVSYNIYTCTCAREEKHNITIFFFLFLYILFYFLLITI